jgi:endogenous inhibitor of DNA gyrase (YacG/DUF329 family)
LKKTKIDYFCPKCKKIVKDTYGATATLPADSMQAFVGGIGELRSVCAKCETPVVKLRSSRKKN